MNREVLFKAKRKDNNEWTTGYLIQLLGERGQGRKFIVNNRFGACIDNKGNFINTESPFVNEVIPETVGQYTGLKDKNGVKIFENDVIQVFNTIGEVSEKLKIKWDNNMGCYEVLTLNDYHYSYDTKCAITGCEVIGNIHDKEVK